LRASQVFVPSSDCEDPLKIEPISKPWGQSRDQSARSHTGNPQGLVTPGALPESPARPDPGRTRTTAPVRRARRPTGVGNGWRRRSARHGMAPLVAPGRDGVPACHDCTRPCCSRGRGPAPGNLCVRRYGGDDRMMPRAALAVALVFGLLAAPLPTTSQNLVCGRSRRALRRTIADASVEIRSGRTSWE